MIKGNTTLIQKDPLKGAEPNNYRVVTDQPLMGKMLRAQKKGKRFTTY